MTDISQSNWSPVDSGNSSAAPDGAPESMPPSGVNDTLRAVMGALRRWWERLCGTLTSSGGPTAYALTPAVALGSYATGERFAFKINATNTGASTLNISGLGAKNIYKQTISGPAAIVAGDLVTGQMVEVMYDGTQFQIISGIGAAAAVTSVATAGMASGGPITSTGTVTVSITGQTAETAPATGDEVALYDVSATAHRKMVLSDLLKVVNGLTEDTTPDAAADFVLTYDTSASAVKKAKPQNLSGAGTVTTIASGSLPAAATQSFTSIPATYSSLHLKLTGVSSNTAARHPRVQLSTNNGVSYDTTAGSYAGGLLNPGAGTTETWAEASLLGNVADEAAANIWNIDVTIWGYQGGPHAQWMALYSSSGGASKVSVGTYMGSTNAINALQILWNGSGNFDAGTYSLQGVT